MRKIALIFSILFTILTFVGIVYVLYNKGMVSAGYAIVPMIFALISISWYRRNSR